jgi:hypothetical protein
VAWKDLTLCEKDLTLCDHGRKYLYKIESVSEGSGGEEYTCTIFYTNADGGVMLVHYLQQENELDFDLAWEIIKNIN